MGKGAFILMEPVLVPDPLQAVSTRLIASRYSIILTNFCRKSTYSHSRLCTFPLTSALMPTGLLSKMIQSSITWAIHILLNLFLKLKKKNANRQSAEGFSGRDTILYETVMVDTYHYVFTKTAEYTTPRVNSNYGPWMILPCQCGIMDFNK